jgi:hypothetical protein
MPTNTYPIGTPSRVTTASWTITAILPQAQVDIYDIINLYLIMIDVGGFVNYRMTPARLSGVWP